MEFIKIISCQTMPIISPIPKLKILKLRDGKIGNGITLGWLIKIMSHMVMVEQLQQIIVFSLMHNGKMEISMDTLEVLTNSGNVINMNIKMLRK